MLLFYKYFILFEILVETIDQNPGGWGGWGWGGGEGPAPPHPQVLRSPKNLTFLDPVEFFPQLFFCLSLLGILFL